MERAQFPRFRIGFREFKLLNSVTISQVADTDVVEVHSDIYIYIYLYIVAVRIVISWFIYYEMFRKNFGPPYRQYLRRQSSR